MRKIKFMYFCLLTLPVIFSACKKSSSTSLVGNWVKLGEFIGTARSDATSFTIQDIGYICTGYGYDSIGNLTPLKGLFAYNSNGDYWTQKETFPGAARVNAVSFSVGNKGYVGTGYNSLSYTNLKDFWEYDPQMNKWDSIKPFGGTARYGAVAFGIGNYGYVGTGFDGNYLKDFWRYNPSSDTWTIIEGGIGGSKRSGASAFVIDDTAYICCGINNSIMVSDFWKFDPQTQTFTRKRDIANTSTQGYDDNYNIVRTQGVAFVVGSKGYVSCGQNNALLVTTWEYDPSTDLWTEKTNFEGAARMGAVAFTINNRAFVATGRSVSYRFDDVYEFKPNDTYNAND